jgi:hypothetical protein
VETSTFPKKENWPIPSVKNNLGLFLRLPSLDALAGKPAKFPASDKALVFVTKTLSG